jgi:hypothetical protein
MTISQTQVTPLILSHLASAANYTATAKEVRIAVLGILGGDPKLTPDINAVNNARSQLSQKGLVGDGAVRGEWVLTPAGLIVHQGGTVPKAPKAPKPPKAPKAAAPVTPVAETPAATQPAADPEGETPVTEPEGETAPTLARAEDGETAPVTEGETAPVTEPAPVAEPAPETAAKPKRRLKMAEAPSAPVTVPEWLADDGIRGVVIANQECFGAFSARAAACDGCALAGYCRRAKAAHLVLLAGKLADSELINPGALPAPVAKLDGAVSDVLDGDAPRVAANPTGGTLRANHATKCAKTGEDIKVGDIVRYEVGIGLYLVKD